MSREIRMEARRQAFVAAGIICQKWYGTLKELSESLLRDDNIALLNEDLERVIEHVEDQTKPCAEIGASGRIDVQFEAGPERPDTGGDGDAEGG